eukprot:8265190-Pyramimonas_sp.AAC.1
MLYTISKRLQECFQSFPTRPRRIILLTDATVEVHPQVSIGNVEVSGKGVQIAQPCRSGYVVL